jgi:hypothetical protein
MPEVMDLPPEREVHRLRGFPGRNGGTKGCGAGAETVRMNRKYASGRLPSQGRERGAAACAQAGWYRELNDSSLHGGGSFFYSPFFERKEVQAQWGGRT